MDWEPNLAPPLEQFEVDEYLSRLPVGTLFVALALVGVYTFQQMVSSPICATGTSEGICFARELVSTSPFVATVAFPLLHGSVDHLVLNLLAIIILGTAFEQNNSSWNFLGLVLVAAYLSIYADIAISVARGSPSIAIGVSGASRALAGLVLLQYAMLNRPELVEIETLIERPIDFLIDSTTLVAPLFSVVLLVSSIVEILNLFDIAPTVAIFAHFVGAVVGILAGMLMRL